MSAEQIYLILALNRGPLFKICLHWQYALHMYSISAAESSGLQFIIDAEWSLHLIVSGIKLSGVEFTLDTEAPHRFIGQLPWVALPPLLPHLANIPHSDGDDQNWDCAYFDYNHIFAHWIIGQLEV